MVGPSHQPVADQNGLIVLTADETKWRRNTFLNRRNLHRKGRPGYEDYATGYLTPKAAYMSRHTRRLGQQAAELIRRGFTVSDRQTPISSAPGSPTRSPGGSPAGSPDGGSPDRKPERDGPPKSRSPSPVPQQVAAPVSRRKQAALKGQVRGPTRSPSPPPKRRRLVTGQEASGGGSPIASPPRSTVTEGKADPFGTAFQERLHKKVAALAPSPLNPLLLHNLRRSRLNPHPLRSPLLLHNSRRRRFNHHHQRRRSALQLLQLLQLLQWLQLLQLFQWQHLDPLQRPLLRLWQPRP